jgi:site-specific recombinase XerD
MAQNREFLSTDIVLSASDVAALRARLTGSPTDEIIKEHFTKARLKALKLAGPAKIEEWLDFVRDQLLRVLCFESSPLTISAAKARRFNSWPASLVKLLTHEAKVGLQPFLDHPIDIWFRPAVVISMTAANVRTLQDLKDLIQKKGFNWPKKLPGLGLEKGSEIQRWMNEAHFLGGLVISDNSLQNELVVIDEFMPVIIPLDRILLTKPDLTGEFGINRGTGLNMLEANNDLAAINVYLKKHRDSEKTLRVYTKEIERFFLWCLIERNKALSSVLVADCESYKDFLANPPKTWVGPSAPRNSACWRPFKSPLSQKSQAYSFKVVNTFFHYLHISGYLQNNPWQAVNSPKMANRDLLDESKALSKQVWLELTTTDGILDQICAQTTDGLLAVQARIARCAMLFMGTTGLRREETATVSRNNLRPTEDPCVWRLHALGKGNKWRVVQVPLRVVQALKEHWKDRDHDFNQQDSTMMLLSPVLISGAPSAQSKHYLLDGLNVTLTGAGFTADSLYCVVKKALTEAADNKILNISDETREILRNSAMHTFRHTFASVAVNSGMNLTTVKDLMGHASISTTSCYVHAEIIETRKQVHEIFG